MLHGVLIFNLVKTHELILNKKRHKPMCLSEFVITFKNYNLASYKSSKGKIKS